VIDDVMGFVDVVQGTVAKAAYSRIVFFAGDVIVRFIEQFHRAMKTAGAVHAGIDRRVIVQILAVVNRGVLDFFDGLINLINGVLFFFVHVMSGSQVLQMGTRVAQVGERVQICGMHSRFFSKT
jgi:hypothetical protein